MKQREVHFSCGRRLEGGCSGPAHGPMVPREPGSFRFSHPTSKHPVLFLRAASWAKMLAGASSVLSAMQAGGEKQGGGETGLPLHLLSRTLHGSSGQPLLRASLHGPELRHLTAFSCKGGREVSSSAPCCLLEVGVVLVRKKRGAGVG